MNVNNSWVTLHALGLGPGYAVFTGKTDPGGALRLSTHAGPRTYAASGGGVMLRSVGPQDGRTLIGWEGGEEGENALRWDRAGKPLQPLQSPLLLPPPQEASRACA